MAVKPSKIRGASLKLNLRRQQPKKKRLKSLRLALKTHNLIKKRNSW